MSFALQAESMDKKEFAKFVRLLPKEPHAVRQDGTRVLMEMMRTMPGGRRREAASRGRGRTGPARGGK